jgi:alkanesulfonate monooxygenase SsuD/methylene tetrahydromethanopterin reductase-like flavin-dependent oxidoreductase (luciferase family)
MTPPKLILILSENWTLVPPNDLPSLVRIARDAEDAGFDAVMVSEHVVLGSSSAKAGRPENPRDYALPENQDPRTPWPSSLLLLAAVAAATERIRLVAGAVIPPLRHPLLLAKELATLDLLSGGRLVVQPTVSWHRGEYEALGVPYGERGERLDEHLAVWRSVWAVSPASFEGRHYGFTDVFLEPKPFRSEGPPLSCARPWRRPGAASTISRWWAERGACSATPAVWPIWGKPWKGSRRSSKRASPRSASSHRSSPTIRRRSVRCAGTSSRASRH